MNLRVLWQLGGRALALAVRLIGREHRFMAAIIIARLLQPVIRASNAYQARKRLRTDGLRETSLDLVLNMVSRYGTTYGPRIVVAGGEWIPKKDGQGAALFVSPHTMLSTLVTRLFHDRGMRPTVMAADPKLKISGTQLPARVMVPTRTVLVTVRDLFAAGETVIAMLDRSGDERRTRTVTTKQGQFPISTPILELALRQRASIVFFTANLDDRWKLKMTFVQPPQDERTTIEDVLAAYAAFMDEHVHVEPRGRTASETRSGFEREAPLQL